MRRLTVQFVDTDDMAHLPPPIQEAASCMSSTGSACGSLTLPRLHTYLSLTFHTSSQSTLMRRL